MPETYALRRDPEQLLREVEAQEAYERRGRLKIFLGYASGVGKSYRMLDEGRRRHTRGEDVVVGAMQAVTSVEVQKILQTLEVIPLQRLNGGERMDIDLILSRRPQVCLVDGLAYNNPPGSRHAERWQDAEELLEAGISVIGTVNLQYIEEYQEQVEHVTGSKTTETIPLGFVNNADEIEVVDAPPEECIERFGCNDPKRGTAASQEQLSQLREIALVLAAEVVDRQLEAYVRRHGLEQLWGVHERILVVLTPRANSTHMIESGGRNARRFRGDLFVVHPGDPYFTPEEKARLEPNLALASRLGAEVEALDGSDLVTSVLQFARTRGITQIFIARNTAETWWERLRGGDVDRLISEAEGIDVRVFPS